MADSEGAFLWAERQQESGGNYQSVNSSSGALGAYQVMPSNLASWEHQAGLPSESASQYLQDPTYQDRLAASILGGYYKQYGAAGAASMWYSGQPDPNKTYGNPPVRTYVDDVLALENKAPASLSTTAFDPTQPFWGLTGGSSGNSSGTSSSGLGLVLSPIADWFLNQFGVSDLKDLAERAGLILLGVLVIIVGVLKFTDLGSTVNLVANPVKKIGAVKGLA